MKIRFALTTLALAASAAAGAACLDDAQVAALASHYAAKTPAPNFETLSDADAACTRAKLNVLLARQLGKVAGYKAGLTNPAVQKRFNTNAPVWGVLYEGMVQPSGFTTTAAFGARPLFEADMLVRVKDAGINQARTPWEVMQHIDQIIPFIELPDLVVQAPPKLNGAGVAAINVGARLGVAGTPIAVARTRGERQQQLEALARMQVQVRDGQGKVLSVGQGSDILEHPLNAVSWIAQALAQEKLALKPGDLVSLGSFSPLMPPRAGLSVTVDYAGLPGAKPVQVNFQ